MCCPFISEPAFPHISAEMSKSGYSGKNGKHELLPHNMVCPWSVADVAGNGTSCPVGGIFLEQPTQKCRQQGAIEKEELQRFQNPKIWFPSVS